MGNGTRGSIEGDGNLLTIPDFVTGQVETLGASVTGDATARGGHGDGDQGLVKAFLKAVSSRERTAILSSPGESLHRHLIAWAADSRLIGETVPL